jgi:hypothetical protein
MSIKVCNSLCACKCSPSRVPSNMVTTKKLLFLIGQQPDRLAQVIIFKESNIIYPHFNVKKWDGTNLHFMLGLVNTNRKQK